MSCLREVFFRYFTTFKGPILKRMDKIHCSAQSGALQAPPPMHLQIEELALIGSRASASVKQSRSDSDFDLVFTLGKDSHAEVVRILAEIPDVVKRYQDNSPARGVCDQWGSSLWEALGGERGVSHLREMGKRSLREHGFTSADSCDVDIFVTTSESQGHLVRLSWQVVLEDDGESVRWEGLGFVSLGSEWQSRAQRLV